MCMSSLSGHSWLLFSWPNLVFYHWKAPGYLVGWMPSLLSALRRQHQGRWKEVWDEGGGGKTTWGLGIGSPPAGSRGGAPLGGLGTKSHRSWRILKVVTSKFYAFLVVFHTFSLTYAYVFSVLAGIIPLSLRNGVEHLIPFAPLVCKWGGATAPSAPGSATYGQHRDVFNIWNV